MSAWAEVVVIALSALLSAVFTTGLTWGVFSERLRGVILRVEKTELELNQFSEFITRREYDTRHKELQDMIRDTRHRDNLIMQQGILDTLENVRQAVGRLEKKRGEPSL